MAKRRMRRSMTQTRNAADAGNLTEGFVDQARQASVGMVNVATDAAKAALSGMQQLGRAMADMAAPAARRSMAAAADAGRVTVQGAGTASRMVSDTIAGAAGRAGKKTTPSATRRARRTSNATRKGRTPRRTA